MKGIKKIWIQSFVYRKMYFKKQNPGKNFGKEFNLSESKPFQTNLKNILTLVPYKLEFNSTQSESIQARVGLN